MHDVRCLDGLSGRGGFGGRGRVRLLLSSPLLSLKYGRRTNCVVVPHVDGCLLARGALVRPFQKKTFEGGGKERMGDCDVPPQPYAAPFNHCL